MVTLYQSINNFKKKRMKNAVTSKNSLIPLKINAETMGKCRPGLPHLQTIMARQMPMQTSRPIFDFSSLCQLLVQKSVDQFVPEI
jgi:hypothetical protein